MTSGIVHLGPPDIPLRLDTPRNALDILQNEISQVMS